jgi:P2 family phage contractile tail tube protein
MPPQIPDKIVNFEVYAGTGGAKLLGVGPSVELPSFEAMTETIKGAGIAGEIDSPVLGHFGSQTAKITWRAITAAGLSLLAPVLHTLDIRGSVQTQDPGLGSVLTIPARFEVRGLTKTFALGKLEPGTVMDTETEIECTVIRLTLNSVSIVELDKFNNVFKVLGEDYLRQVRIDLGGV